MYIALQRSRLLAISLLLLVGSFHATKSLTFANFYKKFEFSKVAFFEKVRNNKNFLFLIGAGGLLSFIFWQMYKTKKLVEQPPEKIENAELISEQLPKIQQKFDIPIIQDDQLKEYYQARMDNLKKLINSEQINTDQIFESAMKRHDLCMQFKKGSMPDKLSNDPEFDNEIKKIIISLLETFGISPSSIEFRIVSVTEKLPLLSISLTEETHYVISISEKNLKLYDLSYKTERQLAKVKTEAFFKFLSSFVGCLGTIASKKLCLEEELEKYVEKDKSFLIKQHLEF